MGNLVWGGGSLYWGNKSLDLYKAASPVFPTNLPKTTFHDNGLKEFLKTEKNALNSLGQRARDWEPTWHELFLPVLGAPWRLSIQAKNFS